MDLSRRNLMLGAAASLASSPLLAGEAWQNTDGARTQEKPVRHPAQALVGPDDLAVDETYWARIRADYEVSTDFVNLENGNWGIMSRPVLGTYIANTERVNRDNSHYARRSFAHDFSPIRERVAASLGAASDELVFTRNATEALTALIDGYQFSGNRRDVMYADLDYGSMRAAMRSLATREKSRVVELSIPEPTDSAGLIAFYRQALDTHPDVRLLLLTHISHRTGLLLPVREIIAIARERGVDVILDAAHSWGQLAVNLQELGADFVGFNLHKWIGAPLGVGLMYVRREQLSKIGPASASGSEEVDLTSGRVHTGTSNFAALLTIPAALDYHESVGVENKTARLRYLRSLWVTPARKLTEIEILTPEDPSMYAGITSFRLRGQTSGEANRQLVEKLLLDYGVFTVARNGVAKGDCVRVTPGLYNHPQDCAQLVKALAEISASTT